MKFEVKARYTQVMEVTHEIEADSMDEAQDLFWDMYRNDNYFYDNEEYLDRGDLDIYGIQEVSTCHLPNE